MTEDYPGFGACTRLYVRLIPQATSADCRLRQQHLGLDLLRSPQTWAGSRSVTPAVELPRPVGVAPLTKRVMEVREASCGACSAALQEGSIKAPEGGTSVQVIPPLFEVAEMPSVRVASAGKPSF